MKRIAQLIASVGVAMAMAAAPAAAQKSKDTLRIPLKFPIDFVSYLYSGNVNETHFETLAVFDDLVLYNEDTAKFEPALAKSWTRVDDKTVDFQLRDDIKWQDGEQFTADDVVDSLNWLVDPAAKLSAATNWEWIDHAEKTGPYSVRLREKRPTAHDFARLATTTDMYPVHILSKLSDRMQFGRAPIGTGPYKATQVDTNNGIILEKVPGYKLYGSARAESNIGHVHFLAIPDPGTQVAQLLAGGVDAIKEPEIDQIPELLKDPRFASYVDQRISYVYMAIDAKGEAGNKALTDVRVRKALFMALDLNATSKMSVGDAPIPPVPAMCWKPQQAGCDYTEPLPKHDVEGAKKLLAEAGYPNGFDLQISCYTGTRFTRISTVIAEEFRQIGIRPTIGCVPAGTYLKMKREAKVQLVLAGFPAGSMGDIAGVLNLFASDRLDFHGDDEIFGWAKEASAELDPAKRVEIGRKIFDAFFQRAYVLPVAPLPVQYVHTKDIVFKGGTIQTPGVTMSNINWTK